WHGGWPSVRAKHLLSDSIKFTEGVGSHQHGRVLLSRCWSPSANLYRASQQTCQPTWRFHLRTARLVGDRVRHAAEDERVKREHRVPVQASPQAPGREVRDLVKPHPAGLVAAFNPPCQPRLAGELHLGLENQLQTWLCGDDAPEVERVTTPQVE